MRCSVQRLRHNASIPAIVGVCWSRFSGSVGVDNLTTGWSLLCDSGRPRFHEAGPEGVAI